LDALVTELDGEHGALVGWGVAWARVLPTVFIVPAFGLGVLPASLRAAMALALAVGIAPALAPAALASTTAWPALLGAELLRGVPIALAAAVALYAAQVAGGVVDSAGRATRLALRDGPVGSRLTPFSSLFGLGAAIVFLANGSAARLVAALGTEPPFESAHLARVAAELATGIGLGASVGAPVLVAALAADVATGIVARERSFVSVEALFAPLRTLFVLVATAALLDRMLEAVVLLVPFTTAPP
jgi:flagellar biosynthetic protein FliR